MTRTAGSRIVSLLPLLGLWSAIVIADSPRPFGVCDSVQMAQFTGSATFSPDRRYFVIATERGVLPEGVQQATIWLFDSSAISESLNGGPTSQATPPVPLTRLTGVVNGGGVLDSGLVMKLIWGPDSKSLLFLGHDGRENRQLFRVRLSDHETTPLSPPTQDVVDFASNETSVVYFAAPSAASERAWWANDPSAPDIVAGAGQSFMDLLFPNYERNGRAMPATFEVWRVKGSGTVQPLTDSITGKPLRLLGSYNVSDISLSPDGTQAAAITFADQIPTLWERYDFPHGPDLRGFRADSPTKNRATEYDRALQYQLFDLEKGTRRPLVAAPLADFQRSGIDALLSAWSPDKRYVAVTGTYMPLNQRKGVRQSTRPCAVAVIESKTDSVDCVIDRATSKVGAVFSVEWEARSELLVRFDDASAATYERRGKRWIRIARHTLKPVGPFELTIRQDLNNPPVLVARDSFSGRERTIFDPNPQLKSIDLGSASLYEWKDPNGTPVQGVLVKPPDFSPGHPYPLVVQTHGFRQQAFFKVGAAETANAGRALAGRKMLVLQVREPHGDADDTWREGSVRGTDVYLAAIDQLAGEGLVDPTRVGISGYSRTGFFVSKAITDSPERFAAAVIANADPGSLIGYYEYVDYVIPAYIKNAGNMFAGAPPYGDNLQKWLQRAPGFRTDRIRAPVLISASDPQHLISLWGLYAPLRDQGKPVELQYMRSGQHNLTKPLQKLAHQEMLVDWFDFWLNGHEDGDETKAEQYGRWRQMRQPQSPERQD
jgi:hypothetical protein